MANDATWAFSPIRPTLHHEVYIHVIFLICLPARRTHRVKSDSKRIRTDERTLGIYLDRDARTSAKPAKEWKEGLERETRVK